MDKEHIIKNQHTSLSSLEVPKPIRQILQFIEDPKILKNMLDYASKRYNIKKYITKDINFTQIKNLYIELAYIQRILNHTSVFNKWSKKQLVIFVWYIIGYTFFHNTNTGQMELNQWKEISRFFPNKSMIFLEYEGRSILKNQSQPRNWNIQEQKMLKQLYDSKNRKWKQISLELFERSNRRYLRTSKQCRQHWANHLDQKIIKGAWNPIQDINLLICVIYFGKKWAFISKCMKNRTQHNIKNRYRYLQKNNNINSQTIQNYIKAICEEYNLNKEQISRQIQQQGLKLGRHKAQSEQMNDIQDENGDEDKQFEKIQNLLFIYQHNNQLLQRQQNDKMGYNNQHLRIWEQQVICFNFDQSSKNQQHKNQIHK